MKIKEACENKGALPELTNMYCLIVWHTDKKIVPCWYDAKTDHFLRHVSGEEAIRTDWQVFTRVKEIRPENAGEFWRHENGGTFYTHAKSYNVDSEIATTNRFGAIEDLPRDDKTHNKGGWTRLYPPVEDDSVERVEIEGVYWEQHDYCTPFSNDTNIAFGSFSSFIGKPRMKMILEIPKI